MYVPGLGERVIRASADLVLAATTDLFAITGGPILMTYLLCRVDSLIGPDNPMTLLMQHDEEPAGADIVFCTAVAIDTDIAGTLYDCDGDPANALRVHTPGGAGAGICWIGGWVGGDMATDVIGTGWILGPGHIQMLTAAGNAGGTGLATWIVFYVPLAEGVAVVAE